ncbi:MAG: DNA primase [Nitrosomonas sp.]|nr:MAG: DNA primase [Nitrosomonas sp.]
MIPQQFIDDLLNRIDIVDTIDRHVPLKKAGANYVACCPFHNEKTPSFTVSPTKQFYHCFGCGAHGNSINFLIEYSGLSFVEAVQDLASFIGMPIPESTPELRPDQHTRDSFSQLPQNNQHSDEIALSDLFNALRIAARYYREQLKISEKAITYLRNRGLSGTTAAKFAIGYAPSGWQNLATAFPDYATATTRKILSQAGLIFINEDGKQYDRFRDRIMFPILNAKGQIIGFGGRVLANEEPKYLNSPETTVFEKGRELYNFFSARRAIREADHALVVEGYMDAIALTEHGIDYAVASLGTATTGFHIQKLLRQTDHIIFSFDGDRAGRKAAWRALENSLPLLTDGKLLSFLFLPEEEDPDSFVRKHGKEAFERLLKQAIPLSEFLFKELCAKLDLQTSEGRAKLISETKPLLQQVTAPALSLILLKRLSELSHINPSDLAEILPHKLRQQASPNRRPPRPQPVTPYRWLILMLLHHPDRHNRLHRDSIGAMNESTQEFLALKMLLDFLDQHPHLTRHPPATSLLAHLQESPYRTLLENIESETLKWDDAIDLEAEFSGALEKLQQTQRKKRIAELYSKPLNLLTEEEKRELQQLSSR